MTRIAVWMLEEARRSGIRDADLLLDHPGLSSEDLTAACQYLAEHPDESDSAIARNNADWELLNCGEQ